MKKTILALVAAMCLVGLVAAESDASTVSATVKAKITIDAPDAVALGENDPGTTKTSDPVSITVESNKNYQVDATASGSTLTEVLEVQLEDTTFADATGVVIYDNGKPGTTFNTAAKQEFKYTDSPGDYTITLTFAATQV